MHVKDKSVSVARAFFVNIAFKEVADYSLIASVLYSTFLIIWQLGYSVLLWSN